VRESEYVYIRCMISRLNDIYIGVYFTKIMLSKFGVLGAELSLSSRERMTLGVGAIF
jgi:hypothetical protein